MESRDVTPILGRYFLLQTIGSGGMGVVYAAFDPQLDRKVALKVLHATAEDGSEESSGQTRLVREAQALAKLSHPNVVHVYDVGSAGGRVFVAMELVEGETAARWLERAAPTWRQVLDVFLAAGRGLAAAHAAGIVHRDFKPGNVLIGKDGRVRVADFGLATWSDFHPRPTRAGPADADRAVSDRTLPLDSALTEDGMVVGTPAYIAPELYRGSEADARADEFSFCVALYEALYRQPPFAGTTLRELDLATSRGLVREAPEGSRVPPWLRRIVRRGLEADREKRYPSMTALLDDLAVDRTARRRRWALGAAGTGVVAAGIAALSLRSAPSPCGSGEERLADAWGPARKELVRRALESTGKPYAPATWSGVERTLDAWSRGWARSYREACEATHVRGEQSAELLDLRMECLASRRRDLEGLTALLSRGGPDVADRALPAAAALPTLDGCADPAALVAPLRPPAAPAARAAVDRLRLQLAGARALWTTARYPEGLERVRAVTADAAAQAYPPLLAEALILRSYLEESTGDAAASERTLYDALEAALRGNHHVAVSRALTGLVWVLGERQLRFEEAHRYARLAAASLARTGGGGEELEADLLSHLAMVESREGRHQESLEQQLAALALYEKVHGAQHPNVHRALNRVGSAYYGLGRLDEALAYFQRALDGTVQTLGPEHPTVAVRLGNMALVYEDRGQKEKALELHRRSMEIEEKALGTGHPQTALSHSNVSVLLLSMGRKEEALVHARRALEIQEKALGPEHPDVGGSLINLGDALRQNGKLEEALAAHRRAAATIEKALSPTHEWMTPALVGQGRALLELKRPSEAIPPLARALSLDEKDGKKPETGFLLARALADSGGDRARARALAATARERARTAGETKLAAEIDAWLAGR